MPYKRKNYKKKTSTKKIAKMRRRYQRKSAISWYPFGATRVAKVRYHQQIQIDPASSSNGTYTFAANGLFDPDITGVGGQPYGFDTLMTLYNHYTVVGSRIRVYLINPTSACMIGVKLSDGTTVASAVSQLLEQPGYKKRMITHADQAEKTGISHTYSTYKFFRRSKVNIMADDSLKGSSASNPSELAYYNVVLGPLVSGTDLPAAWIHVTIDYTAIFHGPRELPTS